MPQCKPGGEGEKFTIRTHTRKVKAREKGNDSALSPYGFLEGGTCVYPPKCRSSQPSPPHCDDSMAGFGFYRRDARAGHGATSHHPGTISRARGGARAGTRLLLLAPVGRKTICPCHLPFLRCFPGMASHGLRIESSSGEGFVMICPIYIYPSCDVP